MVTSIKTSWTPLNSIILSHVDIKNYAILHFFFWVACWLVSTKTTPVSKCFRQVHRDGQQLATEERAGPSHSHHGTCRRDVHQSGALDATRRDATPGLTESWFGKPLSVVTGKADSFLFKKKAGFKKIDISSHIEPIEISYSNPQWLAVLFKSCSIDIS